MGRNSTPLVCFAETMVLYYEMIQIIEMFKTTDRFVKQTPHTLYLTLEKLNDLSVQRKLFAFPGNFLRVSFHDYLLLSQSELVSTLQNGVVTKRQQTLQTSFRLTLIRNFMRLLEACGNFLASCSEDF